MLSGSVTVSGKGRFWPDPQCLRGVQWRIICLQVTQMAAISGWYGSYGSVRPRGHVRHLAFGERWHAKCAMGLKQSLEGVLFGLKSPCLRSEGASAVCSWPPMSPKWL